MLVQLQVDNSKNEILPGSYATVRIPQSVLGKILILPDNTFMFRGKDLQVGVVDAKGVVQLHNVKVGRDFGVQSEILSGVTESDKVIVNPSDSLATGTTVRISTMQAFDPSRASSAALASSSATPAPSATPGPSAASAPSANPALSPTAAPSATPASSAAASSVTPGPSATPILR